MLKGKTQFMINKKTREKHDSYVYKDITVKLSNASNVLLDGFTHIEPNCKLYEKGKKINMGNGTVIVDGDVITEEAPKYVEVAGSSSKIVEYINKDIFIELLNKECGCLKEYKKY